MGNLDPTFWAKGRSRPVYKNVRGAPFRIGDRVCVHCLIDDEGNRSALGKQGSVEYFEYSCGCGQSYPEDPMIGVRFGDGTIDEFWREELEVLLMPWPEP